MHTFYKVLQKNTLRKKICVFLCALCTASLVVLSNANAAGYTCDTLTYVECNSGYYLSDCGTTYEGQTISSPSAGNSCQSCTDLGDSYTCEGGTKCPKLNKISVSCSPGYYIKKDATTCNTPCLAGHYCTGSSYQFSPTGADQDYGISPCSKGTYQDKTGQSSCNSCAKGTYQDTTGQTSCKNCSDLSGVSPAGGTYTTDATGSTTNTACKYTAQNKTISECQTVTTNTVTYNGSSWPATTYTVVSKEGHYISNNNSATATCKPCGTGKYQDTQGQSSCKDCTAIANSTWEESSGLTTDECPFICTGNHTADTVNRKCNACNTAEQCPTGYGDNTYNTCNGETPEAKCKANCQPGYYVAVKNAPCSAVPSTAKGYAAQHYVQYGEKSTLSNCPDGATGNDARASAKTSCYTDCSPTKTINNGTATFASGHVYYSSQSTRYTNNQCKYTVNCNETYGANSTNATTDPSCTSCENGSYSPGGQNTCKYCTNAPDTHATYTTNGTNNDCQWQCNAGYYKSNTSCPSCPNGSTAVPVTSTPGANNNIRGCYISSIKANQETVFVTDSTGTFKYRMDKDGKFNPCYHK